MSTEEKITSNSKTVEQPKPKRRFKFDKKHRQGFLAGFLTAIILITGVTAAINPGFLAATFTKQVGERTLQEEVDLQAVGCTPISVKAQTEYDQTFAVSIEKDKLKSSRKIDKQQIQLAGLFTGMAVESVSYTDEDNRLIVAVKGKPVTTYAYGSDRENPDGEIYIMPGALRDSKTAYKAVVSVEYPALMPNVSLLENKEDFNDSLSNH